MLKKKNRLIATKLKFSGIIVYVVKSMAKIVWQPISGDKTLPDVYKWIERVVKSTTATLNLILTCIKDRRLIWSMKWIGVGTLQFYYSVTIKKCINKLCYNASQSEFSYFKYFAGILTGWLNCNCCFASHQKSESDSATEDGETELDNSDCESSDCEAL